SRPVRVGTSSGGGPRRDRRQRHRRVRCWGVYGRAPRARVAGLIGLLSLARRGRLPLDRLRLHGRCRRADRGYKTPTRAEAGGPRPRGQVSSVILRAVDYWSLRALVPMLSCLSPLAERQKPSAVPADCVVTIVATDVAPALPPWKPPDTDGATATPLAVPTRNWPYPAAGSVGELNVPPDAAPVGSNS